MVFVEFNYEGEWDSDLMLFKFFDILKEFYLMWVFKKYGLLFMYWNMMLKGRV